MAFFENLCFVRFCDEINFENLKKSPRKHQEGGILEDSYRGFVTKLNTPQPSPFCGKLKLFLDFLLGFRTFRHFFEKFNTLWYIMEFLYI